MKASRVKFNADQLRKRLTKYWIEEQTKRLVEYADKQIRLIGDAIQMYHSSNHMDRTGNLLDSLCYVVSYDGKLKGSGFYRAQKASENSYVHELYSDDYREMFPVHGHELAKMFIQEHGHKSGDNQWVVYFAILAPYWGYWEMGHHNVLTHNYEKFAVMANFYDKLNADLRPDEIKFTKSRPSYSKQKLEKLRQSMSEHPYRERRHYVRYPSHK